jgi:pSer/pThr/pTyr-binding forkhead associated (FHA) protein
MDVMLRVCTGRPRTVPLDASKFLIGRDSDCNLILDSPLVSRFHCPVTVKDHRVYARDLHSTNGTGLNNGRLVDEQLLHDGDILWLATVAIQVCIPQEATSAFRRRAG